MSFWGRFDQWFQTRKASTSNPRFRPQLESLETRLVPYTTSGNLWPNPQLVTISFMPDGTNLGGVTSNLFSTFNAKFGSATTWENVLLKAAQVWAQQTNLNFAVVPDSGAPEGSGSYQQGDPTMGDIRIGGYDFGTGTLAQAFYPPAVNNYSIAGDIAFNTGQIFNIGSTYDLFTVAMHEFGHALGLKHSTMVSSVMYGAYSGVKSGLTTDDINGIENIYSNISPRSLDHFGGTIGSFATAADLTATINGLNNTDLATGLDITQAGQKEYLKLTVPAGTGSIVTIDVQSSGLSLLAPTLTVYAGDQSTVLGSASGAGHYGTTLTVTLTNKVSAGQVIYIKVGGADTTAFGTGAYGLTMSFAGAPLPTVLLPNTQVFNGSPLSGGGGDPNADSNEYLIAAQGSGVPQTFPESPQAVAEDGQGDYVVTWSTDDPTMGWSVDAQRFDSSGIAQGDPFQVNTTATGNQLYPTVAMDQAGDFVVTWSSYGQDGDGWGIFGQRYDAQGNPVGREFQINTTTAGDQLYSTVAMDQAGNFVVTWSGFNDDGSGQGIFGQRYDAQGNAVGGQFQVNSTPGYQAYSTVAMDAAGDFVVSWSSYGQDGSGWGVYAQRYDASGNAVGGEFQVNTTTAGDQMYSSVAMGSYGNFVIVWSGKGQNSSGWNVFGQRYDIAGSPLGGEFQVNPTTIGDSEYATVAMNADGDLLVTWSSDGGGLGNKVPLFEGQTTLNGWNSTNLQSSSSLGGQIQTPSWSVYGQQYSGDDGSPEGTEFRVNATTAGNHQDSSIVTDNSGHIVVVWSGTTGDGTEGVFGQRFVTGQDGLRITDAGSDSDQVPVRAITSLDHTLSAALQHPDVRQLPSDSLAEAVVSLPNGSVAQLPVAGSAAVSKAPAEETGTGMASLVPSPPAVALARSESRISGFAYLRGDDNVRLEDQPAYPPMLLDQENTPRVDAPLGQEESTLSLLPGASVDCQVADTWFAAENRMSASTGSSERPFALAQTGGAVLDQGTMTLALMGLLGSFHASKDEEEAQRQKQPTLS
jgi:hypothetical protein